MIRMFLAVTTALALVSSAPALACPDCGKDCPMHKAHAAEKKDADKKTACACAEGKGQACDEHCQCGHCSPKQAQKKGSEKKS